MHAVLALPQQFCMQLEDGNMVACDGSDERLHEDCINYCLESGGWVHVRSLICHCKWTIAESRMCEVCDCMRVYGREYVCCV